MADNLNPNIFLSYCWANTDIANEIDNDFKSIGIQFKRDVRDLTYRKSIKEFMQQIGKTDYVLMIISDEYLHSVNCMYEVTELLNTHEFEKKILPILIDNATHVFKPLNQETYYDYWVAEKKKADKLKKKHSNEVSIDYLKKCQNIQDNLPRFFQKITDLNVSTHQKLKDENYKDLLNIIGFNEDLLIEEIIRIIKIEDLEERELDLEAFLSKNPQNKHGLFQKAYLAHEATQFKKAKKYYEDLLKLDTDMVIAYNNLGVLLQEEFGDSEGAKLNYEKAIRLDAKGSDAHYNLALLLKDKYSDFEGAKLQYEKAITNDPENFDARFNLASLLKNDFFDFDGAKSQYEWIIKINPQYAKAYNSLAILLKDQYADFEGARMLYTEAIKIDSQYTFAYFNLAILLKNKFFDFDGAKFLLEEALKINPDYSKAYYNLGLMLQKHFFDFERAKFHYEKAIELVPHYKSAHYNLAVLLENQFLDFADAKLHYEEAIKIDPQYKKATENLNKLLSKHFNK